MTTTIVLWPYGSQRGFGSSAYFDDRETKLNASYTRGDHAGARCDRSSHCKNVKTKLGRAGISPSELVDLPVRLMQLKLVSTAV